MLCVEDKKTYTIKQADNAQINYQEVLQTVKELKAIYKKLITPETKMVFDHLIDSISYLFKDASYSYEQEMRIMYRFDKCSSLIKHTKQNPPKLFVVHNTPVRIKEVILGPKFQNVANLLPYLNEQIEKMSEITKTDPPKITLSDIDFR